MMSARNRPPTALIIAALLLSSCKQYDQYQNLDGAPGETVFASSPVQRNLMLGSNRSDQWTRIRLIAPPGATSCKIANHLLHNPRGPEMEGKPDANRFVMLTVTAEIRTAAFSCNTPDGVVRRTVSAVPYQITYRDRVVSTARVLPPLVHLDPDDPTAGRRWQEFWSEACPVVSERAGRIMCKPDMPEKLQAADLGPR